MQTPIPLSPPAALPTDGERIGPGEFSSPQKRCGWRRARRPARCAGPHGWRLEWDRAVSARAPPVGASLPGSSESEELALLGVIVTCLRQVLATPIVVPANPGIQPSFDRKCADLVRIFPSWMKSRQATASSRPDIGENFLPYRIPPVSVSAAIDRAAGFPFPRSGQFST